MSYEWAVIGAGPAGIAAVGKLLDHGILASKICWIDEAFKVGDFGTRWANVPSNTRVELFTRFLQSVRAFDYQAHATDFALATLDPTQTCELNKMAAPLQWVTQALSRQVHCVTAQAQSLEHKNNGWQIDLKEQIIIAKQVILANGAEPKTLNLSNQNILPLHIAMDHEKILNHIRQDETIGVFGSSHSAILVLRNLVAANVKKIINFYRSPLLYAIYMPEGILFDDTGLKGTTAKWAHDYVDGVLPENLQRYYASDENIAKHLPACDKIVYAVGFERKSKPTVQGLSKLNYIEECGIIAPGLFGFGIAFPEAKYNYLSRKEYRVGLWKFMEYLERVLPIWLNYPS